MIEQFTPSIRSKITKINKFLKENYQCSVDIDAPIAVLKILKSRCVSENKSISLTESNVNLNSKYTRNLLIAEVASLILGEQRRITERNDHKRKIATNLLYLILESVDNDVDPEEAFNEAMSSLNEFENDFDAKEIEETILDEVGAWDPVSDDQAKAAGKLHAWLTRNKQPNMPDMALEPKQGQPGQDEPGVINLAPKKPQQPQGQGQPGQNSGEMNLDPKKRDPFDNEWKRKLAALRIGNSSPLAKATIESSQNFAKDMRRLLESEVNEAEVLIAAKGFSQELQTIIEKLGRLQNEDLGPVTDRMKEVYGEQVGNDFYSKVNGEFQSLLDSMKGTRDNITGIIMGMAQGQMGIMQNDMTADTDLNGPDDLGGLPEEPVDPALDDDGFAGADVAAGPEEEPLGRAKK
jgi:uncharacterized protein (UPF0335 family)